MLGAARGSRAPNNDRLVVRAAIPEAAYSGKLSMIYVWIGMKTPIIPKPKGISPMMGTIQKTLYSADHPYQKKEIGTNMAKKTQAGNRISGSNTPWLAFVIRTIVVSEILATVANPRKKPLPTPRYANPQISGLQP